MAKPRRGRPPLPPSEKRVTLTVRVRPETKREVERRSEVGGVSQGEVIDEAIGPE